MTKTMTIKEAKNKIDELNDTYNDFLKLQNWCMCMDLTKPGESTYDDSPEKDERREMLQKIREAADIISDIRTLCTMGCNLCRDEVHRINASIEKLTVTI